MDVEELCKPGGQSADVAYVGLHHPAEVRGVVACYGSVGIGVGNLGDEVVDYVVPFRRGPLHVAEVSQFGCSQSGFLEQFSPGRVNKRLAELDAPSRDTPRPDSRTPPPLDQEQSTSASHHDTMPTATAI